MKTIELAQSKRHSQPALGELAWFVPCPLQSGRYFKELGPLEKGGILILLPSFRRIGRQTSGGLPSRSRRLRRARRDPPATAKRCCTARDARGRSSGRISGARTRRGG